MISRDRSTAMLVDMDGVLRRWDPAVPADIERRPGLPAGILLETAMQTHRLLPVITGRVSHADWAAGLRAHRWTGPADLPYLRAALGLA